MHCVTKHVAWLFFCRDFPISWHALSLCRTVLYRSAPLLPLFTETPRLTRSFKSSYSIFLLISKSASLPNTSYHWSLWVETKAWHRPILHQPLNPRGNMCPRHTLQQLRPWLRLRGLKDSLVFITRFPSILSSQGRSVLSAGASLQGLPVPVIHPLSSLISAEASAMSCLVTLFVPVGLAAVTHRLFSATVLATMGGVAWSLHTDDIGDAPCLQADLPAGFEMLEFKYLDCLSCPLSV